MQKPNSNNPNNRNLLIILLALSTIAIVLAAFVIFQAIPKNDQSKPQEVAKEQPSTEEKNQQEAEDFNKEYQNFEEQANALLAQNHVEAEDIIALYTQQINKMEKEEKHDKITTFIREEAEALVSKGYKKEALNELIKYEYDQYDLLPRFIIYNKIIELATELGEPEIVEKYEALKAKADEELKNTSADEVMNE